MSPSALTGRPFPRVGTLYSGRFYVHSDDVAAETGWLLPTSALIGAHLQSRGAPMEAKGTRA